MFDLTSLRKKRKEILKAELFMLLHDVGKLHAGHQGKFLRRNPIRGYRHNVHILEIIKEELRKWEFDLGNSYIAALSVIIEKHHGQVTQDIDGVMTVYAQRVDRLDSAWDRDSIVSRPMPWESNEEKRKKWKQLQLVQAFDSLVDTFSGFSLYVYKKCKQNRFCLNYDEKELLHIPPTTFLEHALCTVISVVNYAYQTNLLQDEKYRQSFFKILHLSMRVSCGDTRLSVNDISLWDHSISTAILYKALSAWLVGTQPSVTRGAPLSPSNEKTFKEKFRPQLFPLRIDGLSYLSDSVNIPDLLARRKTLKDAYDALKNILEWEFPLAGEIYRDENGPVFLTFLKDRDGKEDISLDELKLPKSENPIVSEVYKGDISLNEYLRCVMSWKTIGDLTLPPKLELFTYTQKHSNNSNEKSLGDILKEENEKGRWYQPDITKIKQAWNKVKEKIEKSNCRQKKGHQVEEVCSVCGLRPQGYGAWLVEKIKEDKNRENKEKEARKLLDDWENYYKYCDNPERQKEKDGQTYKAISRRMCSVCLNRREDRAEKWAQGIELDSEQRLLKDHPETVWLDEVADKNGRIALIVGYFPLENWLDGSLVESLAMFKQDKCCKEDNTECQGTYHKWVEISGTKVCLGPKPVSYSRIRRVWETTRRFWQDVAPTDAPPEELQHLLQDNEFSLKDLWEGPLSLEESLVGKIVGKAGPRLEIKGIPQQIIQNRKLGKYHAYELVLPNNVKIAVLWDPTNERLITLENLVYTARNLGWNLPKQRENESKEVYEKRLHEEAADFVRDALHDKTVSLNIPPEYGAKSKTVTTFKAQASEISESFYTPLIPILAEPQVFMAIVPADKAFEVVKAIKTKYEREMGKVRNRLPLHIGVIYAYRKMPLRAIMDAGRRMLKQRWENLEWQICEDDKGNMFYGKEIKTEKELKESDLEKEYKGIFKDERGEKVTSQFDRWHRIVIRQKMPVETRDSDNQKKGIYRYAVWYVPALMGDGQTEDHWYPYVFLAQESKPNGRNRYYKSPNPWNSHHSWLVHAGELEPGDKIYFTPATFDFEFLDSNARRFEIAYDGNGKRRDSLTKPYLLDEVETIERIWKFITKKQNGKPRLSTSQIFALREMIETKRDEWFEKPEDSLKDESFGKFCHDLFINAQWQWKWSQDDSECDTEDKFKEKLNWLTEMAVRGYFTDAIYLFHHVMKEKPEGEG